MSSPHSTDLSLNPKWPQQINFISLGWQKIVSSVVVTTYNSSCPQKQKYNLINQSALNGNNSERDTVGIHHVATTVCNALHYSSTTYFYVRRHPALKNCSASRGHHILSKGFICNEEARVSLLMNYDSSLYVMRHRVNILSNSIYCTRGARTANLFKHGVDVIGVAFG